MLRSRRSKKSGDNRETVIPRLTELLGGKWELLPTRHILTSDRMHRMRDDPISWAGDRDSRNDAIRMQVSDCSGA